jgi:hypothetical protein
MGQIMETCVFIAPGDTPLGGALAEEADKFGYRIISTTEQAAAAETATEAAASTAAQTADPLDQDISSTLTVEWTRRSLLSARNAVLAGLNASGRIDLSIVIHESVPDQKPTHELAPVDIERQIDSTQKGSFYLLRELLACYVRQKSGRLAMVQYAPGEFTALPLCAAAAAAFRGATDALFTLYQNEDIIINGFESTREDPDGFARHIFQTLEAKAVHGKWYRFGSIGRQPKSWLRN